MAAWTPPSGASWNNLYLITRGSQADPLTEEQGDSNKTNAESAMNWLGDRVMSYTYLNGLSIIGNTGNTQANASVISAANNHYILRRLGTTLGFGSIDISQPDAVGSSVLRYQNGGLGLSTIGTSGQLLRVNGAGNGYEFFTGTTIFAVENGLYQDGDTVRMGGPLVEETTIQSNTFDLIYQQTGSDSFVISRNSDISAYSGSSVPRFRYSPTLYNSAAGLVVSALGSAVTPAATLHVRGSDSLGSTGLVRFEDSSGVRIFSVNTRGETVLNTTLGVPILTGYKDSVLQFQFYDDAGSADLSMYAVGAVKRVYIASNGTSYFTGGSVGIGTSLPTGTLDVLGSIKAFHSDGFYGDSGGLMQYRIYQAAPNVIFDRRAATTFWWSLAGVRQMELSSTGGLTIDGLQGTGTRITASTSAGLQSILSGTGFVRLTGSVVSFDNTVISNPMTSVGDMIYGAASGTPTRLAPNTTTSRYFLTGVGTGSAGQAPTWFDLFGTANTWTLAQTFTNAGWTAGTTAGAARITVSANVFSFTSTSNGVAAISAGMGTFTNQSGVDTVIATIQNTSTGGGLLKIIRENGATTSARAAAINYNEQWWAGILRNNGNNTNSFAISSNSDLGVGGREFVINLTTGNISVGKTSANGKFDVNGDIRALYTSGIYLDNSGTMQSRWYQSGTSVIMDRISPTSFVWQQAATQQMVLGTNGNLGQGSQAITSWDTTLRFFQQEGHGSLHSTISSTIQTFLSDNVYYNSGYKYYSNGYASRVNLDSTLGAISFDTAVSGSTAGAVTFTTRLKLNYTGNSAFVYTSGTKEFQYNNGASVALIGSEASGGALSYSATNSSNTGRSYFGLALDTAAEAVTLSAYNTAYVATAFGAKALTNTSVLQFVNEGLIAYTAASGLSIYTSAGTLMSAWGNGTRYENLQVGNAGLTAGQLYQDTAANILANGDRVVGIKV